MTTGRLGVPFIAVVMAVSLILIAAACNKKSETTPSSEAAPQTVSATSQSPAAPAKPVPSFSAAQKVGMYVFPGNNQSHDQQLIDESDCYGLAQAQSGVDPDMGAPVPPSSADLQAAQAQGAASAPEARGGRVRGAARGAAGGAIIGGIAGDAGKGAAIGATVGTVRGGRQQRQANAAAKEQAGNQAAARLQQDYSQQKAAYDQQIGNFKRAFSACLDARGYSVK